MVLVVGTVDTVAPGAGTTGNAQVVGAQREQQLTHPAPGGPVVRPAGPVGWTDRTRSPVGYSVDTISFPWWLALIHRTSTPSRNMSLTCFSLAGENTDTAISPELERLETGPRAGRGPPADVNTPYPPGARLATQSSRASSAARALPGRPMVADGESNQACRPWEWLSGGEGAMLLPSSGMERVHSRGLSPQRADIPGVIRYLLVRASGGHRSCRATRSSRRGEQVKE